MPAPRSPAGYSLYELLMTLAVVSVILGLGLPSLGRFTADARLRAETGALFHAAHLARKESIAKRRVVTLCPSTDGRYCDPENRWSGGWILFVNDARRGSGRRDPDEPILLHRSIGGSVLIMSNRRSYSFRATELRATNGSLIFCDSANRAAPRALIVSYTGRPRVAYEDSRGRAIRCAD